MNRRGFLSGLLAGACAAMLRFYPAPNVPEQVRMEPPAGELTYRLTRVADGYGYQVEVLEDGEPVTGEVCFYYDSSGTLEITVNGRRAKWDDLNEKMVAADMASRGRVRAFS